MAKTPRTTKRSRTRAERLTRDPEKAAETVAKAMRKAEKHRGRLREVWDDLMTLLRIAKAWATGTYTQIPWESLVLVLLAVVYFLSPLDAIPDFLIPWGFIDDVGVIGFVISKVRDDIEAFRSWEQGSS